MRRSAAAILALAALVGAADAKPICVVIHAPSHNVLVHRIADLVRARLARSLSFVVGDGHKERSLHVTIRFGRMRLPAGYGEPMPPPDKSNINVNFRYRTPGVRPPLDFEGETAFGFHCDERSLTSCADSIVRWVYIERDIERRLPGSSGSWPLCQDHTVTRRCTSSAF